ncbi:hypothetical protein KSF_110810 [Reticulibacter mediterranei]|uniref:Uncharacterized protein n=1 Tax=Reticulibacter mediterranei TaxID=2778369 RepID=A0A8J3N9P7_9CHLR|nr:hypothetical protein KSF_110810 [Reticulibacter mediterranei]
MMIRDPISIVGTAISTCVVSGSDSSLFMKSQISLYPFAESADLPSGVKRAFATDWRGKCIIAAAK